MMRGHVSFRAKPLFAVRTWIAAVALAVLITAVPALADERIERLLPEETLFYIGVEHLGPTADKVFDRLQRGLPSKKDEISQDRIMAMLAAGLKLGNATTRAEFATQTGLNFDGSAGFALVLRDPSFSTDGDSNHSILLTLPVTDRVQAEAVVKQRIVPWLPLLSASVCQEARERISTAKREWAAQNPGQPNATPTWEQLAAAHPGLRKLSCPCGGNYTIGAIGVEPTCPTHGPNWAPPDPNAAPGPALPSQKIGGITLVGGRSNGVGYAVSDSHILLCNDMNVLEDAVQAAAGKRPRACLAPPTGGQAAGDLRLFLQVGLLAERGRADLGRSTANRGQAVAPAAKRLDDFLASVGGLTLDAKLDGPLFLAPTLALKRSEATAPLLDVVLAKKLAALELIPETATAALGTNLARPILSKLGDLANLKEPAVGALVKLTEAGADGDAAFALTRGWFDRDMPNLLFIFRAGDREMMGNAAESWLSALAKDAGAKGIESSRVGDCEVRSLKRENKSVHYAFAGPFLVVGTNLEDVKAVIQIHYGASGKNLAASKEFQLLGLPMAGTNLLAFVNLPRLVEEILARDQAREGGRIAATRVRTEGEDFLAGLGIGALQLRVAGEQLKGEGRLVPSAP